MEVRKSDQSSQVVRKSDQANADASALLDSVMREAGLSNAEVAFLTGVSENLVGKWRSPNDRHAPSFAQMWLLPPRFHLELNRAMSRRHGFGQTALRQVLEGLGDLALAVER